MNMRYDIGATSMCLMLWNPRQSAEEAGKKGHVGMLYDADN